MIQIYHYHEVDASDIFDRKDAEVNQQITEIVSDIISNVRKSGDKALFEYSSKFDHANLKTLEVTPDEIEAAIQDVPQEMQQVLEKAAKRIRAFHEKQARNSLIISENKGEIIGQKVVPMDKVGLYVPGGTASYPSSVLMNCIPAKIAGVSEIIMTTPAGNGKINPLILVAAKIAGVDRIFKLGGAQAIAALAFGTESVPKVDKIVGPGNAYVAEAKKQVFGQVAIDMIAGPSEILVIADKDAVPSHVAADLLSQAEHDKMASAVLVTDSQDLASAVASEIEIQLSTLSRQDIARVSIDTHGKIIIVKDLDEAIKVSNIIAPEHLELCVARPFDCLASIRHAGSVFMGYHCPEALGDYMAGPNHTLPTGGTARFSSPLSVDDFVKKMQYTYFTQEALDILSDDIVRFAESEGLSAHARSVSIRKKQH